MKFGNKKEFYSLRKFKGIGLASALVGLMFLGSTVKADETVVSENKETTSLVATTTDNSSESVITESNSNNNPIGETRYTASSNANNHYVEDPNRAKVEIEDESIITVPKEGRTPVSKIDYTTTENPMKKPVGNIYNNQIESIERLTNENEETQRYRIKLKDGEIIPSGGQIVLSTIGTLMPTSDELVLEHEKVGKIRYSYSFSSPTVVSEFRDKIESINKVDELISYVKNINRFDVPIKTVHLEFNKDFEKYNKNRIIEFSLRSISRIELGSVYSENENGSVIKNSKNIDENAQKNIQTFLINPFDDSKVINTANVPAGLFNYKINVPEKSNKFEASGRNYPIYNKPYYLDKVSHSNMSSLIIRNGDTSITQPIIKSGTIFSAELPDNSLFTTTKNLN